MSQRQRTPVLLTSFRQGSLDMYLREVRSIRESRMLLPVMASLQDRGEGEESECDVEGGIDEGKRKLSVVTTDTEGQGGS